MNDAKNDRIKLNQIAMIFFTIIPITKFMILPSAISKIMSNDSWIVATILITLDIIIAIIILTCYKRDSSMSFLDISKNAIGKYPTKILCFIYFAYFMLKAILPAIELKRMFTGAMSETIPRVSLLVPLFLLAAFCAYRGVKALGRTANIMGWVSIISIIILILLSLPSIDITNILPIMNRPYTALPDSILSVAAWFGDFIILLTMLGKISDSKKKLSKSLLYYIIIGVIVVLLFVILISIYGDITSKQVNAIFKISKFNTSLTKMGRYDYIPIIFLMICTMFASVMMFYASAEFLNFTFEFKNRAIAPLISCVIAIITILIINDQFAKLFEFVGKFFSIAAIALQYIIPLFIPLLQRISIKKLSKTQIKSDDAVKNSMHE